MNHHIRSKQILVIEDDTLTRELLQWTLEELGFQVHASEDFEDAAHFLKEHRPLLIISDLLGRRRTTGVDFYILNVMSKKIPFALVSGTFFSSGKVLPPKAQFVPDMQNPHEGKITLGDLSADKHESIHCFEKPFEVSVILQHFHLSPAA